MEIRTLKYVSNPLFEMLITYRDVIIYTIIVCLYCYIIAIIGKTKLSIVVHFISTISYFNINKYTSGPKEKF